MAEVTYNNYPLMLEHTRKELEDLRRERDQLDVRIAKTEQVEAALRAIVEDAAEELPLASATDVIRNILKSASAPMSATEVRDKMIALGFDSGPYSQFLASVHVILKRLWKNGEVFEFTNGDRKSYWWSLKGEPPTYTMADLLQPLTNLASEALDPYPIGGNSVDVANQQAARMHHDQRRTEGPQKTGVQRILRDSQERRRKLLGEDK